MRKSETIRTTGETHVEVSIVLDGEGKSSIDSGVGFFDHMLAHISKQGFMDISVYAEGDLDVDCHHTIEDVGIVFGKCLAECLGDKAGIKRFGSAVIPMEDSLALCAVDFSGRPLVCFDCGFTVPRLGDMDTEMVLEFFRAVSNNCGLNVHIKMLAGSNNHHMCEAIFKAFGSAIDAAKTVDSRIQGANSTKGVLE